MARARVTAKRDFKTPVKGMFLIILIVVSFVLFCELLAGAVRFLVG